VSSLDLPNPAVPSASLAGRFRVEAETRSSLGVRELLATDTQTGLPVVVGAVAATAAAGKGLLARLEGELSSLSNLSPERLRAPFHVGSEAALVYAVRPHTTGITLAQRLERSGRLDVPVALSITAELLDGLAAMHGVGVLHLDLSTDCVIVDPTGQRSVLTYLGLAQGVPLGREELQARDVRHLSPELSGLIRAEVDVRADLYSAGVLLYEILAGTAPFGGTSVNQVLREHLAGLPALEHSREDVPAAVQHVLARLLATWPQDRYSSADAASQDLQEVAAALLRGEEPRVPRASLTRRGRLAPPCFVGRAREMERLKAAVEAAGAGNGGLVLLEAQSGGGKSALIDQFAGSTEDLGAWLLRGQGVDRVADRPYQALAGVIESVRERSERDPEFAERLRLRLDNLDGALAAALPQLAGLLGVAAPPPEAGDVAHGAALTRRAIAALLDALGAPGRPAIVMLDDFQWADELSLELLGDWAGTSTPRRHVLVLAGFRTEEVDRDHPLRSMATVDAIGLDALDHGEMAALVESMVGELPAGVLELVMQASEGMPFVAVELLRGLVETGILKLQGQEWALDETRLPDTQSSVKAAEIAVARIDQLPGEVLDVLSTAAVVGKQFNVEPLVRLARRSLSEVLAALERARQRHIVWLDASSGRWAFVHDKLRERLLAGLSDEERRRLHLDFAQGLESTQEDLAFDLAYHFDAAGESARAIPYALGAAADARRRFSLQIAERYYRIAERGVQPSDLDTVRLVQEGLGDIAMLRGEYDEAERHLLAAQAACGEDRARGLLEGKLGELAFKRGDVEQAAVRLEGGLRMLGHRVARSRPALLWQLVREVVVQILHTLLPGLFLARRSESAGEADLAAARLHSRLAHAYWFGQGRIPCAWSHLRGLNLAERYPASPELAQAYSEHAPVMTMLPYLTRGERYVRRSLEIRRELGDLWGEGQSLNFLGVVLYAGSRYEEALETLHEAVRLLERTGDQWEVSTARWHIAFCLYRLGRLPDAAEVSREVQRAATQIGDVQAKGISLGVWAKATGGHLPDELIDEALDGLGRDVHTACEVLSADAMRRLRRDDPLGAVAALERADQLVSQAGLRQEYVAPVLPWLATALRTASNSASPLEVKARRDLRRRAWRAARRARRLARFYRNNLPHATRELGLLHGMAGRPRRARRLLEASLEVAEALGARQEAAVTRIALAELALAQQEDHAAERLDRVRAELALSAPVAPAGAPPRVTLSLADRFDTVLESGRTIASALTREAVFDAVRAAAVSLLRVPSCALYELGEQDQLYELPGASATPGALEAAQRAVRSGGGVTLQPLVAAGGPSHEDAKALCALIRGREGLEACLCASDEGLDLFGEEEERLAAFIAALGGAALDNARGFAASEAQSRSLEQMVVERTAELNASNAEMESALSLLAATLESTADGILVVDGDGSIVNHNGRFAEMWRIPAELVERGDDDALLRFVADQLVDPESFLQRVNEIYATLDSTSHDLLECRDGRVFERFSKPQRVSRTPAARVWSFHDLTRQKHSERELEHLANHDGLTGLLNRRRFEQELRQAITGIRRRGGTAALLMLDLDNFKYVNDTLGHGAGDELIKSVAGLLQGRLRQTDRIARLGGDEFAVLLSDVGSDDAHRIGVQLLIALRHHAVPLAGRSVSMTASIGVAIVDDGEAEVSQLLADADLAMYEAKRAGRDGISVSAPEQAREARLAARFTWAERLRRALEQDEFELFAQPVLDLASDTVHTHEILLRLRGDDRELITPAQFLPSAERLGLMTAIDRWVVSNSIRQLAPWLRSDSRRRIEINLSGNSIGDAELPVLIADELAASQLDPQSLIFEVTETATIANMAEAKKFAATITALGCRFALDDFGTGFGSFYYLKHLPVDYLKIDGDFISDLPENETDQLIVKSIVDIARGTGKLTIAEFVADRHILSWVRELGVDFVQGYHIGRPVPIGQIDPTRTL
jgi:diguanylate cyclase (GGDEF)-like protein